jgi:hypothetical protein
MPALVAGIHVCLCHEENVDGRNKSGHDVERVSFQEPLRPPLSVAAIELSSAD